MAVISAGKKSQVVFNFDNGQGLSIIWGWGSYTKDMDVLNSKIKYEDDYNFRTKIENTEVEIMPYGEEFIQWIMDKYNGHGDSVIGHIPVNDLPEIIAKAASFKVGK